MDELAGKSGVKSCGFAGLDLQFRVFLSLLVCDVGI